MDQPLSIKEQREQKRAVKLAARASDATRRQRQRWLTWGGGLAALAVVIWGAWYLAQPSSTPTNGSADTTVGLQADDHVRGSRTAKAVLIEYSDFQCPACKTYESIVQAVAEKYGDRLAIVYRHYPLTTIHKNAELAAQAAVAASRQGDFFWAYHDILFDRQSSWASESNPRDLFAGYAEELGINVEQFEKDLNTSEVKGKVQTDISRGNDSQLRGTPTFFLNGKLVSPQSVDEFSQLIDGIFAS